MKYKIFLISPFLRFFGFYWSVIANSFVMALARISKLALFVAPLKFLILMQSDLNGDFVFSEKNPTYMLAILMSSISIIYIGSVFLSRKLMPVLYSTNKYKSRIFLQIHDLPAKEKYFLNVESIVVGSFTTLLEISFYFIIALAAQFYFLSMSIIIFSVYSLLSRLMVLVYSHLGEKYSASLPVINSLEFVTLVIISGGFFEMGVISVPEFALTIFVMRRILLSMNGSWSVLLEPVSNFKRSVDLD